MLPEEMGIGKYTCNLYARTKKQRCKNGFKRIKEKKITGFLVAHFKLNAQRLSATLQRMSYNTCDAAHCCIIYSRGKTHLDDINDL